jgi:septal ring factor EnvC (AmiA/AmiB activator)
VTRAILVLFAALAAALPASGAWGADDRRSVDSRREALHSRMEKLRAELAETEVDRNEAREELRDSEKAISEANRALRELNQRRAATSEQLASLATRKKLAADALTARERTLGQLLTVLYRGGEPNPLKVLLSGDDPNQVARDLHYLSYLSRANAQLLDAYRADLAHTEELEATAREAGSELEEIERTRRDEREQLVKQLAARRKVLQKLGDRIQAQRREVKTLQADEARLARLVERISRPAASARPAKGGDRARAAPATTPGGASEPLLAPLRGVLVHRFGAARPEGGPGWKGIFIRAAGGTEVHAAAAGEVVFADWMRGYGNLIILDHGSGLLTIYGNNESVLKSVGDRVAAGEAIATVGASGGAEETGLYFETRREGRAFDPLTSVTLR